MIVSRPSSCFRTSILHLRLVSLRSTQHSLRPQPLLLQLTHHISVRRYSSRPPSTSTTASRVQDELQRQARIAVKAGSKPVLPERLLIYHAGAGRTAFLAMLKLTSLFVGAFFFLIVTPSYLKADKSILETAGVAACGLVPILFIHATTSPFTTHIHMHLPSIARSSRSSLERYLSTAPLCRSTRLTFTTMSPIGKPRYSDLLVGDLIPARAAAAAGATNRFGLVNYTRDAAAENARRRWFHFRAVEKFYVQDVSATVAARAKPGQQQQQKKTDVVERWVWEEVKKQVKSPT